MWKKNSYFKLLILSLAFVFLFIVPNAPAATFSLSVTPYAGGYDLRYGKLGLASGRINREVTVNITSDIAKQYRLVHDLLEPLSTAQGSRISESNFVVYGIRGTNKYGTINVAEEVPVSLNRQILYTSNQAGTSDSFTLVYGLIPQLGIETGSYRGRISFTLEPIDSTQDSVIVILNIFAELEVDSAVEINTITGIKDIILRADKEDMRSSGVEVNIQGGFGKQFRILQVVAEQPVSSEGNVLSWEAINFVGRGAQKGMLINTPMALSPAQQIIYTSSPSGAAESFVIDYTLGDLSQQKAGRYKTKMKYFLEGVGAQTQLITTLGLEIENTRVFELVVLPENQQGIINFPDLKPKEPPKKNEVMMEVKSNLGKRYQVSQSVYSDLMSKEGNVVPQGCFTLKTESLETKGNLKFPQAQGVKRGDTTLFISDEQGSPDKFKMIYELTVPWQVKAGDYSTRITYSLSEI